MILSKLVDILKTTHLNKKLAETQITSNSQQKIVLDILDALGFIRISKTYENADLPNNVYYCSQPFGKQRAPDIMLINVVGGVKHTVKFELKTGAGKIMWNDGFPDSCTLYLFTDHKRGKTNIFCKRHLVSLDTEKLFDEQCDINKRFNETHTKGTTDGFRFYTRKANSQKISDELMQLDTTREVIKFLKDGLHYNLK